ncbi:hypothetical protein [Bernardetia sp.]|uniref:hypothetical protein n=1 Tax=Bernardetia sp. TaxID=1937974 RepID=UPI0025BAF097|nr:hypothetical protein [Bernardetia sp.]
MNTAPLELSHSLLKTIDSLFIENNISKYFKDVVVVVLAILFFPILYFAFWIVALIAFFMIRKSYAEKINFKSAEEYRQSRIAYDEALPIAKENEIIFTKLKEISKIRYFIFYPIRLIYKPFEWYCKKVKKEFEKLDRPTKEGDLFESISEEEMWKERPSVYKYRI